MRPMLMLALTAATAAGTLTHPAPSQAATRPDSALAAVTRAATAMGGVSALQVLATVHREFAVENSDPTQGARPVSPAEKDPPVYLRDRRAIDADYAGGRERTFGDGKIYGNQPTSVLQVIRPDSIFLTNLTLHTTTAFPGGPGRTPPVGLWLPEGLIHRALGAPDRLRWLGTRPEGGRTVGVVGFNEPGNPRAQRLIFDQATGALISLELDGSDAVAGDVLIRFEYLDYRPVGGVRLAQRIVQRRNGVRILEYRTTAATVNARLPDSLFTVSGGYPAGPPAPPIPTAQAVGRDLYLLRSTYNSMFMVADDGVIVLEAPVDSRRSIRVLEEIHRVAPGKPIRYVVSTHFHSDHIGGLRPFIAAGVTILTTEAARQVIQGQMVRGSRTRSPDTLSAAPRPPVIEVVDGGRTIGDAGHRVDLIDLSPNPHADEMLAVWFPAERLLFEADMLDLLVPEGQPSMPGDDTRALARAIAGLGLDVDRIVPVHGRMGDRSDLERTLARTDQAGSR
jgi:glyoxylase-like metal-dependent hydrolase (beta-lactamase superfamily II)